MIAYLVRHGQAGRAAADSERALTAKGRTDVARMARRLAASRPWPSAVITSPLLRARETGEIIAAGLPPLEPAVSPVLAPGADLEKLLALLNEDPKREAVCLVGHMPELGELAGFLASGKRGYILELEAGALVCAEVAACESGESSSLKWILTPEETS